jgi:hypothetical protein
MLPLWLSSSVWFGWLLVDEISCMDSSRTAGRLPVLREPVLRGHLLRVWAPHVRAFDYQLVLLLSLLVDHQCECTRCIRCKGFTRDFALQAHLMI